MSQAEKTELKRKVNRMGRWAGVRYLRNRGVSFEQAHEIMLGCPPRFK